ncbi:MAG: plasmid stability protein [Burkholderiaceae bacterium]
MSAVTVRNIPEETHRALKLRAAQHGRSTEAEIRYILEVAVRPKVGIGSTLAAFACEIGHVDFDSDMNFQRDRTPVRPVNFE